MKKFAYEQFKQEVLQVEQPVLVDLYADWCRPCQLMAPMIEKLAKEFDGRAVIGKMDVDANHEAASAYEVGSIPTILIFKGGTIVKRFVGLASEASLRSALTEVLG